MYVRDLGSSLLRRWYLVLIGLIFTAMACLATYRVVPPNFAARDSVLLLPPATTVQAYSGNPYLSLGSLNQALDVLINSMNSDAARRPMADAFPGVTVATERDGTTSAPIMTLRATGGTADETMQALNFLRDSVPPALTRLQDPLAVPAEARISSMVLAADDVVTMDSKALTRALVSVAALCLAATVLLTGFIDRVLTTRRARRLVKTHGHSEEGYSPAPDITRPAADARSIESRAEQDPAAAPVRPRLGARVRTRPAERARLGLAVAELGSQQSTTDGSSESDTRVSAEHNGAEIAVDRTRARHSARTRR